jgi:hypothetical protein
MQEVDSELDSLLGEIGVKADEAYSFTCSGALDALAVSIICIYRVGGEVKLVVIPRLLAPPVHKRLGVVAWGRLHAALAGARFWSLRQDSVCLDGVTWEIEGRQGKRQHRATYANPPDGPYVDLGHVFMELAGTS